MEKSNDRNRSNIYRRVTDQIITELKQGVLPWRKPWSNKRQAGLVMRPLRRTGEAYRGINILTLWMAGTEAGYTSSHWMTYQQAAQLGGRVRKGEKGAPVLFSGRILKDDKECDPPFDPREIRYTRAYTVFNVEQIDGLPDRFRQASAVILDPINRDAGAEAFFARIGADVRSGGADAYYSKTADYIQLPPIECFHDAAGYYAVQAHETIHWTSHETRLNRSFPHMPAAHKSYAQEELVAELGAAFLCADLQLTPKVRAHHAAYIDNWLDALERDNRAIFVAAAHAQRACDFLHQYQIRP